MFKQILPPATLKPLWRIIILLIQTVKPQHREVTAQGCLKVRRVWKRTQISQSLSSTLPTGLQGLAEDLPDKAPLPNWAEFNNFEEFQFMILLLIIILFGGKVDLSNYMRFKCQGISGQFQSPSCYPCRPNLETGEKTGLYLDGLLCRKKYHFACIDPI